MSGDSSVTREDRRTNRDSRVATSETALGVRFDYPARAATTRPEKIALRALRDGPWSAISSDRPTALPSVGFLNTNIIPTSNYSKNRRIQFREI